VKAPLTAKEEITKAVANYMADQPLVLVAYLFGSVVRGRLTMESDIDIAMLFWRSPNGLQLLDTQEELTALLGRQADVVGLNQAVLAMQVLKYGECVFERSPRAAREFRVRTMFAYFDLKSVRKCVEEALISD
jgi:predicted nucleotidyltransferase